ncbi:hypothetical protein FX815_08975 [Campylobacter jejuni]|nr:hypothetical protein [Campylobacter jejuni]
MENKKFILVYAIYIGIIALIYFFGKDFLLVFDNLKNFFLSANPVYYMLSFPISMFFVFIAISFLEKRGINGVLVYLLTVIPLLFLFFYYSNANFSLNYFRKLYDLQFPIILILFIVVFSCFVTLTIDEKRL